MRNNNLTEKNSRRSGQRTYITWSIGKSPLLSTILIFIGLKTRIVRGNRVISGLQIILVRYLETLDKPIIFIGTLNKTHISNIGLKTVRIIFAIVRQKNINIQDLYVVVGTTRGIVLLNSIAVYAVAVIRSTNYMNPPDFNFICQI